MRAAPLPSRSRAYFQHVTTTRFKLQGGSRVALNWAIDSVRKGGTISVVACTACSSAPSSSATRGAGHALADALESNLGSLLTRPDNPITETGVLGELNARPSCSRIGHGRAA